MSGSDGRWRGFNLTNMFTERDDGNFEEDDFRWIRDWGFNFVRIPMSYRLWAPHADPYQIEESMLDKVDRVVRLGQTYGLHVSLNFHRAPGYCINPPPEPFSLWRDPAAEDAFVYHWRLFAERYRGIPSRDLSFDLVNEPPVPRDDVMRLEDYERVVRRAVATIRSVDPDRLILCEGHSVGNEPCTNLVDLGIGQSCRGYIPATVTHYRASWVHRERWPEPTWPEREGTGGEPPWNRERLRAHYAKWAALKDVGILVHCGEMGVYKYTPHAVTLAWYRDVLEILEEFGIGWAVWNFRRDFGILDTDRSDVAYEDWYGHKLDRALLTLLQSH